jgi:hypothetical protein
MQSHLLNLFFSLQNRLRFIRYSFSVWLSQNRVKSGCLFVELLNSSLLRNRVFKSVYWIEPSDRFLIQSVYTFKCSLSNSFLVISQEQASELTSLEEIFAMILRSWHCKHFYPLRAKVLLGLDEADGNRYFILLTLVFLRSEFVFLIYFRNFLFFCYLGVSKSEERSVKVLSPTRLFIDTGSILPTHNSILTS